MIEQKFSIGIDISADDFHVSLMWFDGKRYVVKGSRKFSNKHKGFVSFLEWASKRTKGQACARSTRKTSVQKTEIVKTHSADFQSSKLKQRRFFIAFHTCFSVHRTRSVA